VEQMAQGNTVVMKYINDKISKLDSMKNSLMEEMKKITINSNQIQPLENILDYIHRWNDCKLEEKKNICGYFINKIYLKDDEINIDWKL